MKIIIEATKSRLKSFFDRPKSVLYRLKSVSKPMLSAFKRFWGGYGYYISLACLLALFGTAAYLYRSGHAVDADAIQIPEPETVAAMARLSVEPTPSPVPTPYIPRFEMPVDGQITAEYAPDSLIWNDTLGQWRAHSGIDIAAAAGTAVRASESGTVSAKYADDLLGNVIEITHDDDWVTRYCSLESSEPFDVGDHVARGDIIGSVGASALVESSAGPHLHFEILKNGESQSPEFD